MSRTGHFETVRVPLRGKPLNQWCGKKWGMKLQGLIGFEAREGIHHPGKRLFSLCDQWTHIQLFEASYAFDDCHRDMLQLQHLGSIMIPTNL